MRVSIIVNPRSGSAKLDLLKQKIEEALFRCDLFFHYCESLDSLCLFVKEEIENETSAFLICGGDGTINATLQCLLRHKPAENELPPICLISSGTANDLAHEIKLTERIDHAARLLFEGREKKIDIIEVEAGNEKKYMITNGGIGIPALAANTANELRKFLNRFAEDPEQTFVNRQLGRLAQKVVKSAGSTIYSMSLLNTVKNWTSRDWALDIEFPDRKSISTSAPFILVNNQPTVGKKFLTAPYTSHDDGQVNVLIIESDNILTRMEKILRVYTGTLEETESVKSLETSEFKIKSRNPKKKITFFGDGEILFQNVDEVKVRCLNKNIGVMVKQ